MSFPSDLEIARKAELKPLGIIAKESGIPEESLELYGEGAAKIKLDAIDSLNDVTLHKMNFISPYIELPKKLKVKQNLIVYGKLYNIKNLKEENLEALKKGLPNLDRHISNVKKIY